MELQKQLEKLIKSQQESEISDYKEWYLEFVAKGYGSAKSYTNLVIVVGYGVFFATWRGIGAEVGRESFLYSGILMGISALAFVLWEVFQMVETSIHLRRNVVILEGLSFETFSYKRTKFEKVMNSHQSRVAKIWIFQLLLTLVPALIAVWIFMHAIFDSIILNT